MTFIKDAASFSNQSSTKGLTLNLKNIAYVAKIKKRKCLLFVKYILLRTHKHFL